MRITRGLFYKLPRIRLLGKINIPRKVACQVDNRRVSKYCSRQVCYFLAIYHTSPIDSVTLNRRLIQDILACSSYLELYNLP